MTTKTVRAAAATFARSDHAATEYHGTAREHLRVDSAASYPFVRIASPAPDGATVASAVIEFTQEAVWAGSRTMTLQRHASGKPYGQINWDNQPSTLGGSTAVAVTQAGTILTWSFDMTADYQAIASGAANYGLRLITSDTTARNLFGFRAATGAPRLVITYSLLPSAPTDLSPADGAVSVAKPTLVFRAPADTIAIQVQIDPDEDFTVAAWDSGEVATDEGQLALTGTSYPGLAVAATTAWRARVKNALGWSPWSDVETFSRQTKPTVTITNPGATSADNTPTVTWTCPGQTAWQVVSTVAGATVDDSGLREGADLSYTLAKGPKNPGAVVTTTVYCLDAVDRVETAGDPVTASDSQVWTLTFDATVTPVTTLTVTKDPVLPVALLAFSRVAIPDEWVITRDDGDGEQVISRSDGVDLLVSGSNYAWTDWGAPPNRESTYRVAPVVNGVTASSGPTDDLTPLVEGLWVLEPTADRWFTLSDPVSLSLAMGETSTVYLPLTAAAAIVRRFGVRGLEGGVTGRLRDALPTEGTWTCAEMDADLDAMRDEPALACRLVFADVNIPASVRLLTSVADAEEALHDRMVKVVSFEAYQQIET